MANDFAIGITTTGYSEITSTEDGPVERWVEVFAIGAEDDRGRRWILDCSHAATLAAAELALIGVEGDPAATSDRWLVDSPRYGSAAWDHEAEYGLACFEADAFDEPRPIW